MKRKHTMENDELPNEREALSVGLELVKAKWDGHSEFDKGMRLLQKLLGVKRRRKKP